MNVKIWVDDERPAPVGYIHACTYKRALNALEAALHFEMLDELWLDHDLGEADPSHNGATLARWLLEQAHAGRLDWFDGRLACQSANPVGREHIMSAFRAIGSLIGRKVCG